VAASIRMLMVPMLFQYIATAAVLVYDELPLCVSGSMRSSTCVCLDFRKHLENVYSVSHFRLNLFCRQAKHHYVKFRQDKI
jgi:hypothetical protein